MQILENHWLFSSPLLLFCVLGIVYCNHYYNNNNIQGGKNKKFFLSTPQLGFCVSIKWFSQCEGFPLGFFWWGLQLHLHLHFALHQKWVFQDSCFSQKGANFWGIPVDFVHWKICSFFFFEKKKFILSWVFRWDLKKRFLRISEISVFWEVWTNGDEHWGKAYCWVS